MAKSTQFIENLVQDGLDLATIDPSLLRDELNNLTQALTRRQREQLTQLDDSNSYLNDIYDNLLPSLRRIYTKANKRSLKDTLANTYDVLFDESCMIAEALRDARSRNLLNAYVNDSSASLPKREKKVRMQLVAALFDNKTAPEITTLFESFFKFRAYDTVAQQTHVTYLDADSKRLEQRSARKHIRRETRSYGSSFTQHRENVEYRLTQLSALYDGLLETTLSLDLTTADLVSIAENYHKKVYGEHLKPSTKYERLVKSSASLTTQHIDHAPAHRQLDNIDTAAEIQKIIARVASLSDVQREYFAERSEEYRTLSLDYAHIRRKSTHTNVEKMLVI